MKAGVCYLLAVVLGLLGVLIVPSSARDVRRFWRLHREGVRVNAEITRIEEEWVSTDEDSEDRARWGPSKIVETATVRYTVEGKEYQARHRLLEPIRQHKPGDTIAVVILPDEPARSMATYEVTGSWIMSFMAPLILLGGSAVLGWAGWMFGSLPSGESGKRR